MTVAAREYTSIPSEIDRILADLVEQFLQLLQRITTLANRESDELAANFRPSPVRNSPLPVAPGFRLHAAVAHLT